MQKQMIQESIGVGCVPPACEPYVFRWPSLGVNVMQLTQTSDMLT